MYVFSHLLFYSMYNDVVSTGPNDEVVLRSDSFHLKFDDYFGLGHRSYGNPSLFPPFSWIWMSFHNSQRAVRQIATSPAPVRLTLSSSNNNIQKLGWNISEVHPRRSLSAETLSLFFKESLTCMIGASESGFCSVCLIWWIVTDSKVDNTSG